MTRTPSAGQVYGKESNSPSLDRDGYFGFCVWVLSSNY